MQTSNLAKYIGISLTLGALIAAPAALAAPKKAHADRSGIQIPIIIGDPQTNASTTPAPASDPSTTTDAATSTDTATTTPTTAPSTNDVATSSDTGTTTSTTTTDASTTPPADSTPPAPTPTPAPTPVQTPTPAPKSNPVTTLVHTLLPSKSSSTSSAATTSTTTGVAASVLPNAPGGASIYTDTKLTSEQAELLLAAALALGVAGFMLLESETLAALLARPRARRSHA